MWGRKRHAQSPKVDQGLSVLNVTFDLSGMEGPTSSYDTTGLALRIIWPYKPQHYEKGEIFSVGIDDFSIE